VRSRRRQSELPLPRSFKLEQREHWLDKYEREIEDHENGLRKRVLVEVRAEDSDADLDRSRASAP
jgi:hypothetical protein